MNDLTRKDTLGSVAILAAILVSALCAMFAAEVQATAEGNRPMCEVEA